MITATNRWYWFTSLFEARVCSLNVLRMKEGTASGPDALWGFRFFKSLWTPFQSNLMDAIVGISLLPLSGMAVVSSAVNADLNCWFKMLALA